MHAGMLYRQATLSCRLCLVLSPSADGVQRPVIAGVSHSLPVQRLHHSIYLAEHLYYIGTMTYHMVSSRPCCVALMSSYIFYSTDMQAW